MKLFELFAELSLDSSKFNRGITSAGKQGQSFATSLSGGFQAVSAKTIAMGHVLYDVGKKAVETAVNFSKSVIAEYADTEQLLGGVETLFQNSSDIVVKNAQNAFMTAGMSANEYMETVTSFSASLLQGLGGDTRAAAKAADMAVQDMSDNANKMGTDMSLIQNAYQGFAKDNFSMLDNLKLGYGGTAAEMARLINDSGVLGKTIVTAANVSEVPLDKMYEAIHAVQTEMGITGTTAKEAASTISGSFNAFQASWKNLLAGMGTDQEMDVLIDNLFDTGEQMITNVFALLPKIGERTMQAFSAVLDQFDFTRTLKHAYDQGGWEAVIDAGTSIIGQKFTDFWNNTLPGLATDGVNAIIGGINSLFGTNIPTIESIDLPTWEEISETVTSWWEGIKGSIEQVAEWTLGVFNDPIETADDIKLTFSTWWDTVARPAVESACTWTLQMFTNPTEDQAAVHAQVAEWWGSVGSGLGSVATFVASLIGYSDGTSEAAGNTIEQWWETARTGIESAVTFVASLVTPDEDDTKTAIKKLTKWYTEEFLPSMGDTFVFYVRVGFDIATDGIENLAKGIKNALESALDAIGLDWLIGGSSNEETVQLHVENEQAADAKSTAAYYTGRFKGLSEDVVWDTFLAYAQAWDATGGNSSAASSMYASEIAALDSASRAMFNEFANILSNEMDPAKYDYDDFIDWFETTEEDGEIGASIESLNANISALNTSVQGLPGEAAASAAAALNGAKVEMDGQVVGNIVISAMSRLNRTTQKTYG